MWSWLQKLMSFFQGEEEQRIEDDVRSPVQPATRQLQAKTKNIYPKERANNRTGDEYRPEKERHFRFPVVPDDYLEKKRKDKQSDTVQTRELRTAPRERQQGMTRDTGTPYRDSTIAPQNGRNMEAGRNTEKQPAFPDKPAERASRQAHLPPRHRPADETKKAYKPSEIVSPVYGKITPATREEEHRIHTTSGIVYPRLEQVEHLNQLKQREMQQQRKDLADAQEAELSAAGSTDAEANAKEAVGNAAVSEEVAVPEEAAVSEEVAAASVQETARDTEALPDGDETMLEQTDEELAWTVIGRGQTEAAAAEEAEAAVTTVAYDAETSNGLAEATEEATEHVAAETGQEPAREPVSAAAPVQETDTAQQLSSSEPFASAEEPDPGQPSASAQDWAESSAPDSLSPVQGSSAIHAADGERSANAVQYNDGLEAAIEYTEDRPSVAATADYTPALNRLLERAESDSPAAELEVPIRQPLTPAAVLQEAVVEPSSRAMMEKPAVEKQEPEWAYSLPQLDLLHPSPIPSDDDDEHTQLQKLLLEETLANFNVSAQVVGIVKGPSVTRFELQPAPGVKVNKITSLIDDIKLNLAAKDIRIEAPIPGRNAIGIEVPNLTSRPVMISTIIGSDKFQEHSSPLAVALGMDIGGEPIIADIKKMPHGLIAGATGSGKSVCINSIIVSLLYKATPEQVRLLLIDPKMVELAPYNHLPHLVTPVVTEAKQATAALKWAVEEMEKRYALFVDAGVRDIDRYNQTTDDTLPYIVIVIDELADLMMVSPQDVEDCIIRIAQKARACGIHLLLATQRPSVDVITGNIKANVPTRLAFAVFSQVDSRTILDQSGAERLLGRGDMLFLESGTTPVRLQGNFVSDDEIERITQVIKKQRKPSYIFSKEDLEQQVQSFDAGDDPLYLEALVFVAEQGQASASGLQRRFRVGYNRAARLIEMMEADGYVAGQSGGKARAVLISREDAQAVAEGSTLV